MTVCVVSAGMWSSEPTNSGKLAVRRDCDILRVVVENSPSDFSAVQF